MANGKELEALAAFVEERLVPDGFKVTTNKLVYNDDGVQIAEFDVEIRGLVESTEIAWLIECRDRPGSGSAPASWIEQLVGRRLRFGFSKVIAVSTSGFAAGAAEFAASAGIELREVKAITPEAFAPWLQMRELREFKKMTILEHAFMVIDAAENEDRRRAALETVRRTSADAALLKSHATNEKVTAAAAFQAAVHQVVGLFDDVVPNGAGKKITLEAAYAENDYFVIETELGPVPIRAIRFRGELCIVENSIPLAVTKHYRQSDSGELISQLAGFAPQQMLGHEFSLELHRMGEDGETHVILRRV